LQVITVTGSTTPPAARMHYCGAKKHWNDGMPGSLQGPAGAVTPAAQWSHDVMHAPLLRIAAGVKAENVASLQRL